MRVWREWFGSGGARARYARSAEDAEDADVGRRLVVHRPGQVIALDSTPLPVKLRESVFGEAVSATLTLGLDLYTHPQPSRIGRGSITSLSSIATSTDVSQDMEWPYPGVPSEVIAEFAGHDVAALPFFAPETVTTDHGSVYKNHDLVEAERSLGCNILPARAFRASDKFAVERAFSAFKTMLFEHLLGFTGTDVADRGADPEADAVMTCSQMEHVIATWIVKVWQNHRLGEYAPSWGPEEDHSPNSLFAAAMHQGGWSMQIDDSSSLTQIRLSPELAGLQHEVLDWLSRSTTPQVAFHKFADLQVIASIVNATWPHTADATHLPHVLTAALDEHYAAQEQAAESVGGKPPHRGSRHPSLWSTEPCSSAATAALLTIAETHLRQPVHELRETLVTLLEHAPETPDRRRGATWVTLQRLPP